MTGLVSDIEEERIHTKKVTVGYFYCVYVHMCVHVVCTWSTNMRVCMMSHAYGAMLGM